jgi:hypothetical protein
MWDVEFLAGEESSGPSEQTSPAGQVSTLFGNFAEWEVGREYRRLIPEGQLHRRANRLTVLMSANFFILVLVLYFFQK